MTDQWTAAGLYGATPQAPSYVGAPTQALGTDEVGTGGWRRLVDPANPLVWFGIALAVTVGLIGVAGSVRLGPARASLSVGE